MTEVTGQPRPHEYYLGLAASAPKIAIDDPRVTRILSAPTPEEEKALRRQFTSIYGNNFYLLFDARRREQTEPGLMILKVYLERARELGQPWEDFLKANADLLAEIDKALEAQRPMKELLRYEVDLFTRSGLSKDEAFKRSQEVDQAVDHPLGTDAISIADFDRLNPLLHRAAEAMELHGINPRDFFG